MCRRFFLALYIIRILEIFKIPIILRAIARSLCARVHFHESDASRKKAQHGKDTLNIAKRYRYDMLSYIYQIQCDVSCMLNVDCHVCGFRITEYDRIAS